MRRGPAGRRPRRPRHRRGRGRRMRRRATHPPAGGRPVRPRPRPRPRPARRRPRTGPRPPATAPSITGADPPYFLWPGVPARDTALLSPARAAPLQPHRGQLQHGRRPDPASPTIPEADTAWPRPAERAELDEWMAANWSNWRAEVLRALDKGNLVIARADGDTWTDHRLLRLRGQSARALGAGGRAARPHGPGSREGRRSSARCTSCDAAAPPIGLGRVGRSGRALCRGRRAGERHLLRLPKGLGVNLLPVPRTVELTDVLVANRPPARRRLDPTLPAQGYTLHIGPTRSTLVGGRRGRALLRTGHPDAAGPPARGASARRARCRIIPTSPCAASWSTSRATRCPTTDSLKALIDRLASLKINQVQLYSEHTFAYAHHGVVHGQASPLDAEEITELDAFCRARHVELVPNQNCLGHMNRWLAHEPYRHAGHRARRVHRPLRHHAARR